MVRKVLLLEGAAGAMAVEDPLELEVPLWDLELDGKKSSSTKLRVPGR